MSRNGPGSILSLQRLQLAVLLAVIVGFVASNVVATVRERAIDEDIDSIVGNAMPSVQHLSAARSDLHRLDDYLHRYVAAAEAGQPLPSDPLRSYRQGVEGSLSTYTTLPFFPNERSLFSAVSEAKGEVDRTVAATVDAVDARDLPAAERALAEEHRENDRTDESIGRLVTFDAVEGERLGLSASVTRRSATQLVFLLEAVVGVLAVVAASLAAIALRRSLQSIETATSAAERQASLWHERSAELEQFAGRVAHDILSPLAAVGFGLELSKTRLAGDAAGIATVERAMGSLVRVQRIVVGLLDFARAGARPDPEAAADLRDVVQGVVEDVRREADAAGVELRVEPLAEVHLACSPGVLSSLVANLVRNAIKYMGDSTRRRVTVRATVAGESVRVEVDDTGPGVVAELQEAIFEPFFRAGGGSVPGSGLGLATVKKLAQAHGGRAGCRSQPGSGSTFWFELPKARPAAAAASHGLRAAEQGHSLH